MTTLANPDLDAFARQIEANPFHTHLGLQIDALSPGRCVAQVTVTEALGNLGGMLHGGAWYALLDIVAWSAIAAGLEPGVTATTVNLHCALMRGAKIGQTLTLTGRATKVGRAVSFGAAEAHLDGALAATGTVTKAVRRPASALGAG